MFHRIAASRSGSVFLDLETSSDQAKLADPARFLSSRRDRFVVLDEVQHAPGLFSELRAEIDADRRPGRFLLLGSASFSLLRQAQTLAGRLEVIDMAPLLLPEVTRHFEDIERLWVRSGFPGSYVPSAEEDAWQWRQDFIRHFLNVDLPAFGIGVDPPSMGRFWRMLAHLHGQVLNASALSRSLGVSAPTVIRWLDHLVPRRRCPRGLGRSPRARGLADWRPCPSHVTTRDAIGLAAGIQTVSGPPQTRAQFRLSRSPELEHDFPHASLANPGRTGGRLFRPSFSEALRGQECHTARLARNPAGCDRESTIFVEERSNFGQRPLTPGFTDGYRLLGGGGICQLR
jgi:hypothetical protein